MHCYKTFLFAAAECKTRWINIRDINRRIIRKVLQNPGRNVKMYKYFHELAFMRPFYKDLMIQSADFGVFDDANKNCKQEDDDDEDDALIGDDSSDDSEYNRPILKKRKSLKSSIITKRRKIRDEQFVTVEIETPGPSSPHDTSNQAESLDPTDKIDSFLLSIGATLKSFTPYHLNMAKTKIFAVVQEHELQQIVSKQGGSTDALE